jgi:hypothetical protein
MSSALFDQFKVQFLDVKHAKSDIEEAATVLLTSDEGWLRTFRQNLQQVLIALIDSLTLTHSLLLHTKTD